MTVHTGALVRAYQSPSAAIAVVPKAVQKSLIQPMMHLEKQAHPPGASGAMLRRLLRRLGPWSLPFSLLLLVGYAVKKLLGKPSTPAVPVVSVADGQPPYPVFLAFADSLTERRAQLSRGRFRMQLAGFQSAPDSAESEYAKRKVQEFRDQEALLDQKMTALAFAIA